MGQSQAKMETAIQRLSSGLRINSAKDDTAGSAISQRMQNQIRGQRMASNNIKQGTDLVQTAEGGLGEIQGILSRMRELAVQAASDNLNANDRDSIDLEYQQLKQEVNRIANSTNYNNMNLLDGSRGGSNGVGGTQGTAGSSGTGGTGEITNITDLLDSSDGLSGPNGITIHNDQLYWTDTSKIQQADLDGSNITDLLDSDDGLSWPIGLTTHNDQLYWTDTGSGKIQRADLDGSNITDLVDSSDGLSGPRDLTIHNDQLYWTDDTTKKIQRSDLDGSNITDLVDGWESPKGITIHNDQLYWTDTKMIQRADLDGSNITDLVDSRAIQNGLDYPHGLTIHNDQLYWTDVTADKIQRADLDGSNITDLLDSDDGLSWPIGLTTHNDQLYWTDYNTKKIQRADLNLASGGLGDGTSDFTLQIGANNSTDDRMIFGIDSVTTDSLLLADTDVDTLSDAQTTINSLDAAIDFINDQRSNLGAVQNRLGFADSNLMSSIQNTESSLSTIRDADFAIEASNLARTQILTQSGTAMLAQANQISQNILSLLK